MRSASLYRLFSSSIRSHNLLSPPFCCLSSLHIVHDPKCLFNFRSLYHRSLSSISPENPQSPTADENCILPITRTRTRTPLETQFETWIEKLKPGFTPPDVDEAICAQSDPDLALDIFRWTAQQRGYKHNHLTYLTMIKTMINGRRYRQAETLVEEVLAGACEMSVPLYNSIIRFCCGRKMMFNRAFDVYKKMFRSDDCKPTLETYTLLLNSLLRRFNKLNVCYVYLHAVKSLNKQMKASGVIPDTFVLNMIIKAYAKCLEVDEAIRIYREMGLYGCEPNEYTFGYIAKGMVPSGSTFMVLICSLAMERRFEDAIEVLLDMVGNSLQPDLLTYKTVLEGMCREGRGSEALELLEELKKKDRSMGEKSFKILLNCLHFLNQD
ncbi:pentatricopeptide repeat-containing protein At3g25210, mitochondrial-like isoform X2 [Tripterygium wilfordii]|uniref:pentatricopeptide repeat-containing protein At3g25210, mitochondrial-like isoform X2 n=1 Tax=Tripterygium wilfordii TaxID=458696 RepID=UPI0018F845E3|nr:pentatricopeptide repeat-containing protein At3g25210, mitochondrial-like isoform X2 [Tripterygium wilfordii]